METVCPLWTTFSIFLSVLDKLIDIVNFEEQIMVGVKLALEKMLYLKVSEKTKLKLLKLTQILLINDEKFN
mgnify:CR=1 FL=1